VAARALGRAGAVLRSATGVSVRSPWPPHEKFNVFVPKSSRSSLREGPDAPRPFLGVGAQVRLRQRQTTGVVIGYSPHRSRVWVRWEDTGEVTHILIANLERVPAVSK
jgi:hypothetical protein